MKTFAMIEMFLRNVLLVAVTLCLVFELDHSKWWLTVTAFALVRIAMGMYEFFRSIAPTSAPPAGFDSDPMMESDDRPFRSVGHLFGRYGHFGTPIVGTAVVPEPSANPLPNSGYPLTHEETEAMLAECPQPSVVADIGLCKIPKGTFPERAEPRYDERCGCEPVPEDCKAFGINSPKTDTGD